MSENIETNMSVLLYPNMKKPHYITRDEIFGHLSETDFYNFIHRYYLGEKSKELLDEYRISSSPQKLTSRLPTFFIDSMCPYCEHVPMISKGTTRNKTGNIILDNNSMCHACGHNVYKLSRFIRIRCTCDNCNNVIKNAVLSFIAPALENKKNNDDYENLHGIEKIFLAALLRSGQDEFARTFILPKFTLSHSKLSPTDDYSIMIIKHFLKNNWIRLSEATSEKSIQVNDGKLISYFPLNATFRLNINDDFSLMDTIISPEIDLDDTEKSAFWFDIAYNECLEYLRYQLDKFNLIDNIGPKTEAVLKDGLKSYSTAQMYNHIYSAVKDAAAQSKISKITVKHAVNMIPGFIQRRMEKALAEGWEIKGFGRNYDIPQSIVTDILFNKVMMIGEKGFTMRPKLS